MSEWISGAPWWIYVLAGLAVLATFGKLLYWVGSISTRVTAL